MKKVLLLLMFLSFLSLIQVFLINNRVGNSEKVFTLEKKITEEEEANIRLEQSLAVKSSYLEIAQKTSNYGHIENDGIIFLDNDVAMKR